MLKKVFVLTLVSMFVLLIYATNNLNDSVNRLSESTDILYEKVLMMEATYEVVLRKHLIEALVYAPKGKSVYQLRGDAQAQAQLLLNRLTTKHNLVPYNLPGIRFRGALRRGAAGTATPCENEARIIYLNEILFYRNYEEFLYGVIPHEVAHVFTCLNGGYIDDAHGTEWEQAMVDLGFKNVEKEKTHELDLRPVYQFQIELSEAFGELDFAVDFMGHDVDYWGHTSTTGRIHDIQYKRRSLHNSRRLQQNVEWSNHGY